MKIFKKIIAAVVTIFFMSTANAQRKKEHHYKEKRNKVVYNKKSSVTVKRSLPRAIKVTHKQEHFSYQNGRYYKHLRGKYILVSPPRGLRVKVLPVGFITIVIRGRNYYHYEGVYYRKNLELNEYEVVEAPEDIIVYTLPEDTEEVEIDGKIYYESYGTLYKVVVTPEGKAFKVVGELED